MTLNKPFVCFFLCFHLLFSSFLSSSAGGHRKGGTDAIDGSVSAGPRRSDLSAGFPSPDGLGPGPGWGGGEKISGIHLCLMIGEAGA